ncbi:MAG: DUF3794 domain-containing protein [Oscillospiraceae bacterium]|nr:DUF3794 domain-containing protein [Oscillospiraceae bacterium]
MDLKVTRFGVTVGDIIYDQMAEQSVDTEFTLPDYCPDISRILKCRVKPRISSKSINGAQIGIDGVIYFTLIFADGENKINSYEYSMPFTKNVDVGDPAEYASVNVKAKQNYMNCRAVNPRKVDLHGAIGLFVKVTSKKTAQIISDIDDIEIQQKLGTANATIPMGASEKHLIVEDEIELGQGKPSIRSLIRCDARAVINDTKIISNKAVIKGELMVSALYCPDPDGRPQLLESTIPFSQIMDVDGITENCECDTSIEVISFDLKPRTGINGEVRNLMLESKLCVCATAFCNNEVPVLFDAFSTKYDADVVTEDVAFEKIISQINERYSCKKTLEFSENAIGTVVDLWCESQVGNVKKDNKNLVINGTVDICILAYDSDDMPVYYERPVEYEYNFELEKSPTIMKCEPQVEAIAASYTLFDSSRLETRIELNISASVFDVGKIPLVTEVTINENSPKKKSNDIALIIYYADSGENVWDIARKYNTSPKHICSINDIKGDNVTQDKMLLIPCV